MALSADSHPHFTTIAKVISSMEEEIAPLFRNVLMVCSEEGLIGGQMFAIDGCKITSNCSKEWSGTRADFERKKAKLEKSIRVLLRKHREMDESDGVSGEMREKEKAAVGRLRAKVKKIKKWLAEGEDKIGRGGRPKQSNLTDNESAKMPGSHGVVQGYNGLAAVDSKHQVVVHAEAFGVGTEKKLLMPMLEGVEGNFGSIGEDGGVLRRSVVVADNGFHSEANVKKVLDSGIDAYLPDGHFRKRDPAFATARCHRRSVDRKKMRYRSKVRYFQVKDFRYDEKKGKLICPAGKEMYVRNRNFYDSKGNCGVSYMAKKTDCRGCELRSKCLRKPNTVARQVTLFQGRLAGAPKTYNERMIERFDSALGRYFYSRRLGIIEPVFANICHAVGLNRFTLRGKVKVDIQWKLYTMVHNILKILRYSPRYA
jgi:hypothetical protein